MDVLVVASGSAIALMVNSPGAHASGIIQSLLSSVRDVTFLCALTACGLPTAK